MADGSNKGSLSGFDFYQIVEDSRRLPAVDEGRPSGAVELPPSQGQKEETNPYIEPDVPQDKVAVPTHYLSFSRVFVLWKNWEDCPKCTVDIADELAAFESRRTEAEKAGRDFREEFDKKYNHI